MALKMTESFEQQQLGPAGILGVKLWFVTFCDMFVSVYHADKCHSLIHRIQLHVAALRALYVINRHCHLTYILMGDAAAHLAGQRTCSLHGMDLSPGLCHSAV